MTNRTNSTDGNRNNHYGHLLDKYLEPAQLDWQTSTDRRVLRKRDAGRKSIIQK